MKQTLKHAFLSLLAFFLMLPVSLVSVSALVISQSVNQVNFEFDSENNTVTYSATVTNDAVCTTLGASSIAIDRSLFAEPAVITETVASELDSYPESVEVPVAQNNEITGLIDSFDPTKDRLGLVLFDAEAIVLHDYSYDYAPLKNSVLYAETGSGSNLLDALQTLRDEMSSVDAEEKSFTIIVDSLALGFDEDLLSDEKKGEYQTVANEIKDAGFHLNIVSVGPVKSRDAFLTELASEGAFYWIGNINQLGRISDAIALNIRNDSYNTRVWDDVTELLSVGTFISATNGGILENNRVSWNLGTLACGESRTVSYSFRLDGQNVSEFSRTSSFRVENDLLDQATSNTVTISGVGPVIASKISDDKTTITNLEDITFAISLDNVGKGIGRGISVSVELPEYVNYVSSTIPGATVNGQSIAWSVDSINPDQTLDFEINARVILPEFVTSGQLLTRMDVTNGSLTIASEDVTTIETTPDPNFSTFVNCVVLHDDNTFTAYYGYLNRLSIDTVMSRSDFHPSSRVTGEAPGTLLAGRHDYAFTATAEQGTNIVWTAKAGNKTKTSTASSTYRQCSPGEVPTPDQVIEYCSDGVTPKRIYTTLGDWSGNGVPNYLVESDTITNAFLQVVQNSLPEKKPVPINNPQYIADESETNIKLYKDAKVWVTFVHEGAGYKNVLGFYTYDLNNPPQTTEDIDHLTIIFPNSSRRGSGGGLEPGNKVELGTFTAGTGIGWFLVPNGWNQNAREVKDCGTIYYSDYRFNPEPTNSQRKHNVQIFYEEEEKVILGFEDLNRAGGSDDDFNDVIYYLSVDPIDAVDTDNIPDTPDPEEPEPVAYVCSDSVLYGFDMVNGSDSQLFRTFMSSSDTFTVGEVIEGYYVKAFDVHPQNLDIYAIAGGNGTKDGVLFKIDKYEGTVTELGTTGMSGSDEVNALAFHPDGSMWIFQNNVGIHTVNLENGETTLKKDLSEESAKNWAGISWDEDGTYLYGAQDNQLYRYDPESGDVIRGCGGAKILPDNTSGLDLRADGTIVGSRLSDRDRFEVFEIDINACEVSETNYNVQYDQVMSLAFEQCEATPWNPVEPEPEIPVEQPTPTQTPIVAATVTADEDVDVTFNEQVSFDTSQINFGQRCEVKGLDVADISVRSNSRLVTVEYSINGGASWLPVNRVNGLGTDNLDFGLSLSGLQDKKYELVFRVQSINGFAYVSRIIDYTYSCSGELIVLSHFYENGTNKAIVNSDGNAIINTSLPVTLFAETRGGVASLDVSLNKDRNVLPLTYDYETDLWFGELPREQLDTVYTDVTLLVNNGLGTEYEKDISDLVNPLSRNTSEVSIPDGFIQSALGQVGGVESGDANSDFVAMSSEMIDEEYFEILEQLPETGYQYEIIFFDGISWEQFDYESYVGTLSEGIAQHFTLFPGLYYIKVTYPSGSTFTTDKFVLEETSVVRVRPKLESLLTGIPLVNAFINQVDVDIFSQNNFDFIAESELENDADIVALYEDVLRDALFDMPSQSQVLTVYWNRWDDTSTEQVNMYLDLHERLKEDAVENRKIVMYTDENNAQELESLIRLSGSDIEWYVVDSAEFLGKIDLRTSELVIFDKALGTLRKINGQFSQEELESVLLDFAFLE